MTQPKNDRKYKEIFRRDKERDSDACKKSAIQEENMV